MDFTPDYRHMADVAKNVRPARLPLYEHTVGAKIDGVRVLPAAVVLLRLAETG